MTRRIQQREAKTSHLTSQRQAQSQGTLETEEYETGTKASAQGSLNLNLFAAVSGLFGSKTTKITDTAPDGSSRSIENSKGVGHVKGVGAGTLNAQASGEAKDYAKKTKAVEQSQRQGQEQLEQVNHLGIEG